MPKPTEQQIKATQQKRYAKRRKYTGATAPEPQKNPPTTVIYGRILEIKAQKTQPHICDRKCVESGHRYIHKFTSRARILGLPNGDLLITSH